MQLQTQTKIKYFLYARKSTESEDKQAASIEDQIGEMKKIARENNLEIADVLFESKSAKAPGREVFNSMMDRIHKGEANGILCWKINRLARNPVDGGTISWMLQTNIIKQIYTHGRLYNPTDNVLMMAVELGMANQFIIDLSTDTKRGLRNKAQQGWFPGVAKPGYRNQKYNDKGIKELEKDPERFILVQNALKLMLTGAYSPYKVLDVLNNEWGYLSLVRKGNGGRPMASSAFYKLISDPFYYGWFEYPLGSGNWYKGKHEPMITKSEFNRIQSFIGKRDYSRPHENSCDDAFYGSFRCAECDSTVSPDEKIQTICSVCKNKFASKHNQECPKCHTPISEMKNPTNLRYLYYGCTKKKNPHCTQKGVRSNVLEEQILAILKSIRISEDMKNWYIERLNESRRENKQSRNIIQENFTKELTDNQKRLDNLFELMISPRNSANQLLTNEEFSKRKNTISKTMSELEEKIKKVKENNEEWIEAAVKTFNFACFASYNFEHGDTETKKLILAGLGTNLTMKDQKACISLPSHLKIIKSTNDKIKELKIAPEPNSQNTPAKGGGLMNMVA